MTTTHNAMRNYPSETSGDHPIRNNLVRMIRRFETTRPRTLQSAIGPSQVGKRCDLSLGWDVMAGQPNPDHEPEPEFELSVPLADVSPAGYPSDDPLPAIVGTSVHAWLERAAHHDNAILAYQGAQAPRWMTEVEVHVPCVDGTHISGSLDLFDTANGTVLDWKVVGSSSLKKLASDGVPAAYRTQVMLYALGLESTYGLHVKQVGIAFVPRNGPLGSLRLYLADYDENEAREAMVRLDVVSQSVARSGLSDLSADPSDENCRFCPVPRSACPEGGMYR